MLAPRLNAAGRVGEAMDAARLLLAATPEEAATLAAILEEANATRKDLMRAGLAEARAAFALPDPGQAPGQQAWLDAPAPAETGIRVAGGPDQAAMLAVGPWPVGILGLDRRPARRRDAGCPRIVGTVMSSPGGDVIRASCRSDGRMDLAARPRRVRRPLHPPRRSRRGRRVRAAGRPLGRVRANGSSWSAAAAAPEDPRRPLNVDLALPARLVDYGLYRDLAAARPVRDREPGAARRRRSG